MLEFMKFHAKKNLNREIEIRSYRKRNIINLVDLKRNQN